MGKVVGHFKISAGEVKLVVEALAAASTPEVTQKWLEEDRLAFLSLAEELKAGYNKTYINPLKITGIEVVGSKFKETAKIKRIKKLLK